MARIKRACSGKKKFLIAPVILLVLLVIADGAISVSVYEDIFGSRYDSYAPLMLRAEDFEDLEITEYKFPSDKGQTLTGYFYRSGGGQKGVVVMAHGFGGGGHNSYMNCADYFAKHGYYVFAFDATGNDSSEGESVGGLPQGVIDLDRAIDFIGNGEALPQLRNLPVFLFGHSWGGYCVCEVLKFHPEVRAVIEISGFNSSSDLFEAQGKEYVGGGIYLMLPFARLYDRVKFGRYASTDALDGFAASDAAVMVIHSADDSIVPIEYGYDKYFARYGDDPRFTFLRLEDRGHSYVYNDMTYIDEFNSGFDHWLKTLDYDYQAAENAERFKKDKADYINANLDRERWANNLNTGLFETFVGFYDRYSEITNKE